MSFHKEVLGLFNGYLLSLVFCVWLLRKGDGRVRWGSVLAEDMHRKRESKHGKQRQNTSRTLDIWPHHRLTHGLIMACMKISLGYSRTLGIWPHHRLPHGMILAPTWQEAQQICMCIYVIINWRLAQHENGHDLNKFWHNQ